MMEWRLNFNQGELKLMNSLNDTQTKLYIVLKMLRKDFLAPDTNIITSYMMKNIAFWLCELNPTSQFSPDRLIHWVLQGLRMLRRSIKMGYLPYYMIPARNLLSEKAGLTSGHKNELMYKISCLLRKGPLMVFVCRKLNFGMTLWHHNVLEKWSNERRVVEYLFLNRFPSNPDLHKTLEYDKDTFTAKELDILINIILHCFQTSVDRKQFFPITLCAPYCDTDFTKFKLPE